MYDLHTYKKPKLSSMSIVNHKVHRVKLTPMAPKSTRVGTAAVIDLHLQDNETTCRQPSKRLPNNSTIFASQATAITGAELLPTHGSSSWRCSSLLWLNDPFAGSWKWRHREPFYLRYHEPDMVIVWQGHKSSFVPDIGHLALREIKEWTN